MPDATKSNKPQPPANATEQPKPEAKAKFQFHSRALGLRVNIKSPTIGRDEHGRRFVKEQGVSVKFTNGVFATDDAELAALLREHAKTTRGVKYHEVNTKKLEDAKAA